MNVANVLLKLVDFIANLCDLVYNMLLTQVPLFNCSVLDLIFVLGAGFLITILIIKFIKGE